MRLVKAEILGERIEISAQMQLCVEEDGDLRKAMTFGGRTSRSGATHWPDWVEGAARVVLPLASLSRHALDQCPVYAFSGGGNRLVRFYKAKVVEVDAELENWTRWRSGIAKENWVGEAIEGSPASRSRPYPQDTEPEAVADTDAGCIARAISLNETLAAKKGRLTNHEVSIFAEEIEFIVESGINPFWRARLRWFMDTVAVAAQGSNGPRAWKLQKAGLSPRIPDFIEVPDELDELTEPEYFFPDGESLENVT